ATACNFCQAGAGGINVDVLTSLSAAGAISLNSVSNDFTNVTVGSGTDVTLADINDIALDAITTTGNLTVATANGVLTTSASAINVGAGPVSLTAGSSGNDNLLTVGAGGITGAGGVTLVADNMDIIGTIDSGTNITTLRQFEAGTLIDVGGADAAGTLGLSDVELDRITSTGGIQIGNTDAGDLTVSAAVNPAASANLRLTTGGAISIDQAVTTSGNLRLQSAAGTSQMAAGDISAAGLSTAGTGAVDLTAANNTVTTFASSSTADVALTTDGALAVGTLGGISGVNLAGNDLTLTTGGALTQTQNIQVGDLTVTTNADGITLNAANNIITGTLTVGTPAAQTIAITNNNATELGGT